MSGGRELPCKAVDEVRNPAAAGGSGLDESAADGWDGSRNARLSLQQPAKATAAATKHQADDGCFILSVFDCSKESTQRTTWERLL